MEDQKFQRIMAIIMIAAFLLYVAYEMYSRYKDNCRREVLAAADLDSIKAQIKMYETAEKITLSVAKRPGFRWPWEKRG